MANKMWDQITDTIAKFLVDASQTDINELGKIGQTLAAKGMKFLANITTGKMTEVKDSNVVEKSNKSQGQSM